MHTTQRIIVVQESFEECGIMLRKLKTLVEEKRLYEDEYTNLHPEEHHGSHKLSPIARMVFNRLLEQLDPTVQATFGERESATYKSLLKWMASFEEFLSIFSESKEAKDPAT